MTEPIAIRQLVQPPPSGPSARGLFGALEGRDEARAAGLYIHIPFCFHKCHYCDFYSIVDRQDRQGAFVDRLIGELRAVSGMAKRPLSTIFVGGGTPTLLRVELWRRLLVALGSWYDLSLIRGGGGEFTVECNPETATAELMGVLAWGGVNRLSVGAQSFNPAHLKTLERWHDPANVTRTLALARDAGIGRQSLDLIFAIPGQTLDDWLRDLDQALSLGTEHVSCYSLTYEAGTAMTARLARGEFTRGDEDVEVAMHHATLDRLRSAGLDRYEVSNYARPGVECRHNLAYWRQDNWLAAGPGASSHLCGHRWKNVGRLDDYLRGDDAGFPPITDREPADPRRNLRERIMTGLRLREGLAEREMMQRTDDARDRDHLARVVKRLRARGWLRADRWALTDEGFLFADSAAGEMMESIGSA